LAAFLLLRGILKGETMNELAAELKLNYLTVLTLRRDIQENAEPNIYNLICLYPI
jgi:hypothetical protein